MVVGGNMLIGNTHHHPRDALSSSFVGFEIKAHPSDSVVSTYLKKQKKTTSHLSLSSDYQSYQPFDTFTFHPSPLLSLRVIRCMLMLLVLMLLLLWWYLGHSFSHPHQGVHRTDRILGRQRFILEHGGQRIPC